MQNILSYLIFSGFLCIVVGFIFRSPLLRAFLNSGSVPNLKTPAYLKLIARVLFIIGSILLIIGSAILISRSEEHSMYPINQNVPVPYTPSTSSPESIVYTNSDYRFSFTLPANWEGYTVVENTWEGNPLVASVTKETGPELLIRNPKWTSELPYQDIPVLVFTVEQWNLYIQESFSVSAAPIPATELARNNRYVFALPPRWNFDYSEGYEEAEDIINSNPLKAFDR